MNWFLLVLAAVHAAAGVYWCEEGEPVGAALIVIGVVAGVVALT